VRAFQRQNYVRLGARRQIEVALVLADALVALLAQLSGMTTMAL
jgi:hypothetical protein